MRIIIFFILLLCAATVQAAKVTYSLDFDANQGQWSNLWSTDWNSNWCNEVYACTSVDAPKGMPGNALKMELRNDDCVTAIAATTHVELHGPNADGFNNYDVWIAGKVYINSNTFQTDLTQTTGVKLFQYHGSPDACDDWRRPEVALTWFKGKLSVEAAACTDQCDPNSNCNGSLDYNVAASNPAFVAYPLVDDWNDIILHGKLYYTAQSGEVNVWVNGDLAYSSSGHYLGWHDTETPGYWKFGMYDYYCMLDVQPITELFFDDIKVCYGTDCDPCDVWSPGMKQPEGYTCP